MGRTQAPYIGEPPPKHVGHKEQNSIAVCCRKIRQHVVDGVTIRYTLMGSRFATHRRGGRVSRPPRTNLPAEVIPIWYIWAQAWRMWNHMPELLWILEGLAGFNVVKLTILKLAVRVFLQLLFHANAQIFRIPE